MIESPLQNSQFWSEIKIKKKKHAKNDSLITLELFMQSSVQKTAWENTKDSRNVTILKIGHRAKPIALAKWSVWVKN